MDARRAFSLLIVVLVSMITLAPCGATGVPEDESLEHLPVHGAVSPEGTFTGYLTVFDFTVDDGDQVHLTGALNGIATHRMGAEITVTQQLFSAIATQLDPDRTTDVLRLQIGPISLAGVEGEVLLAPITLDIYAVPDQGHALVKLPCQ